MFNNIPNQFRDKKFCFYSFYKTKTRLSLTVALGLLFVGGLIVIFNNGDTQNQPAQISNQISSQVSEKSIFPTEEDLKKVAADVCGDGICADSENYQTCPLDCPVFKRAQKPGEEVTPADINIDINKLQQININKFQQP